MPHSQVQAAVCAEPKAPGGHRSQALDAYQRSWALCQLSQQVERGDALLLVACRLHDALHHLRHKPHKCTGLNGTRSLMQQEVLGQLQLQLHASREILVQPLKDCLMLCTTCGRAVSENARTCYQQAHRAGSPAGSGACGSGRP